MSRRKQPETVASVWGLRCPHCGRDDQLTIEMTTWATVTVAGTVLDSSADYDSGSACNCMACNHCASLCEFEIARQPKEVRESPSRERSPRASRERTTIA